MMGLQYAHEKKDVVLGQSRRETESHLIAQSDTSLKQKLDLEFEIKIKRLTSPSRNRYRDGRPPTAAPARGAVDKLDRQLKIHGDDTYFASTEGEYTESKERNLQPFTRRANNQVPSTLSGAGSAFMSKRRSRESFTLAANNQVPSTTHAIQRRQWIPQVERGSERKFREPFTRGSGFMSKCRFREEYISRWRRWPLLGTTLFAKQVSVVCKKRIDEGEREKGGR
ncbi:hypothetical protein B0H11DRAFT_1921228 [Mycena galericulata]|nr:hypothetical protein B0H11DRAFT_1921228 [Mycena galericulata]